MAIGVLISLPGIKQQQYEQVTAKIFGQYPMDPGQSPDGLIVHSAGPTPDGWYVYDIWESTEQFQRFGEERVSPAMQEVMGAGTEGPQPQFFEITALVVAR